MSGARHLGWPIPLAIKQYVSSGYGMRKDPFHGRPAFHVDVMGGDHAPDKILAGSLEAVKLLSEGDTLVLIEQITQDELNTNSLRDLAGQEPQLWRLSDLLPRAFEPNELLE